MLKNLVVKLLNNPVSILFFLNLNLKKIIPELFLKNVQNMYGRKIGL